MKVMECVALIAAVLIVGVAIGYASRGLLTQKVEAFDDFAPVPDIPMNTPVSASSYTMNTPAGGSCAPAPSSTAPCPSPDPTKWVLRKTIPPCPPMPDLSKYMLKTECLLYLIWQNTY